MSVHLPRAVLALPFVLLTLAGALVGCRTTTAADRPAPTAPPGTTSQPAAPGEPDAFDVPAGRKAVSSAGLQFTVPSGWPVVGAVSGCDPLPPFTVVRGGGPVAGCGYTEPASVTVVSVEATQRALGTARLADGRTEIHAAVRGSTAMLVARGPDAAILAEVVGSLRRVDVDLAGCAARLPDRASWDRPSAGPGVRITAVRTVSVSVCVYDVAAGVLAASARLEGAPAQEIVAAITAAKPGKVPDDPTDCAPGLVESRTVRLYLHQPDLTDAVSVHYENCTDRYVASRTGVSQVTARLLAAVHTPLDVGYGFTGDLPRG